MNSTGKNMNVSQQRALANVLDHISTRLDAKHGEVVTHSIQTVDYSSGFWLTVEKEMMGLPTSNFLRYVAKEHWFIWVGPRGGCKVTMCPKRFEQFAGGNAFGMNFPKDATFN